jgi:hypothetical protein
VDLKYFHPHIPPAWLARPELELIVGKEIKYISEIIPGSSDSPDKELYNDPGISFKANSLGYRAEEYRAEYTSIILSLGMSSTTGLGVRLDQTYSSIIAATSGTEVLNFGIPGASCDTIARMICCIVPYFKTISQDLTVLVAWPYDSRREIFTEDYRYSFNTATPPPIKDYLRLIDDTSNQYNKEKNVSLVRTVCGLQQVNLLELDDSIHLAPIETIDRARDGMHPGPIWHKDVADWFLTRL